MTVATSTSSTSRPRACSAVAARQRSASPSNAMPRSAPCSSTAACNFSMCVEPQSALMLMPSGSAWMVVTVAPALANTCGPTCAAAPFAQSTTTLSPSSRASMAAARCAA
ncbi:Uncharacterised protein [Mycobacteroides abscessus subsp. abscessus]|nr:Uncharacterised protein [Mycobacteroides abscessus subsp. abscessus]